MPLTCDLHTDQVLSERKLRAIHRVLSVQHIEDSEPDMPHPRQPSPQPYPHGNNSHGGSLPPGAMSPGRGVSPFSSRHTSLELDRFSGQGSGWGGAVRLGSGGGAERWAEERAMSTVFELAGTDRVGLLAEVIALLRDHGSEVSHL